MTERICAIGTGYVGLVVGACPADWAHRTVCVDKDRDKIASLERGGFPLYETGLDEVIKRTINSNRLTFSPQRWPSGEAITGHLQMNIWSVRVWMPAIAALSAAVLSCSGEHNPSGPPAKKFLTWEARFGGTGDDEGTCAVVTPDGGFLIAGVTSSFGAGVSDGYVIKVDSSGHLLCERTVSGSEREWVTGMTALESGTYVVTGVSNTLGHGVARAYAFELDQKGVPKWERAIVPRESFAAAVVKTPDGGLAFTGQDCGHSVMLLKTDAAGSAQWATCFGSGWGKTLTVTSDSSLIIVGAVGDFGNGGGDILIIRSESPGTKRWSKRIDVESDD